jgi:hypothetical protein
MLIGLIGKGYGFSETGNLLLILNHPLFFHQVFQ